jgi:hypothetical protein
MPLQRWHSGVRVSHPAHFQGWEILVSKLKLRQSAKLREIRAVLEADGFIGLDAQAEALGLSRSTAWTILSGSHKSSGLSATTLNRMLASPLLGERARVKILEYIAEKRAGHYGTSKLNLRKFDQRLILRACPPSPPMFRLNSSDADNLDESGGWPLEEA